MKKNLVLCLSAIMLAGALAGCGKQNNNKSEEQQLDLTGEYAATVWVAEAVQDLYKTQIEAFNTSNDRGIKINATIEPVGEGDAASKMITSVAEGADLYGFPQDQLARLVTAEALQPLGNQAKAFVNENNDGSAVKAATVGDTVYAYPLTSDNGYFMYYDKSVVAEAHVGSLEDIIADCAAAGKKFSFELEGSAWYTASFFFGAGCVSEWKTDSTGAFTSINDTFNSAEGLLAAKGMYKLVSNGVYNNSSKASSFGDAVPSAVVISGTWDYNEALTQLGDNLGVAELPSFTVDGKTIHIGSFSGNKLLGVKPQTDAKRSAAFNLLAQYLSGKECQIQRFEEAAWGPSNKEAQQLDAIKNAPHLAALAKQSAYATPQGNISGAWWDIGKAIAAGIRESDGSDAALQAVLKNYKDQIDAVLAQDPEEARKFGVVGSMNEWSNDIAMKEDPAGTWTTLEPVTLEAGAEFKVRQGGSWDVAFGKDGNNFVVETAGSYYIKLVYDEAAKTGEVTLIPAE